MKPSRFTLAVPSGERRRFKVSVSPSRRGDLKSRTLSVRSSGPLRIAGRQRTLQAPGALRVLPAFKSQKHLPSKLQRLRELDGQSAVQIRGAGTEFDSLRDYVQGDDVRSIDWRATARRQAIVVRTWRPERDRRVVIVMDTSRTSAARIEDEPRIDTSIEAALLLAILAHRGGDRVDFIAYDRRVRARVSSTTKADLLSSLAQALAPVEPEFIEMNWDGIPAQVRSASTQRALVFLLTSIDAGAPEDGLIPIVRALAQNHVVVVASVLNPGLKDLIRYRESSTEVYRAAAAERALLERRAVAELLKQAGAHVVDASPTELPPQLADMYIQLKATGQL